MAMINESHSSYRLKNKTKRKAIGAATAHTALTHSSVSLLNAHPVSLHLTCDQGAQVGVEPVLSTRGHSLCFQSLQSAAVILPVSN